MFFHGKATKFMKIINLKKWPSKRTRLTYDAYFHCFTAKNGRFLAIIRDKLSPTFRPDLPLTDTFKISYNHLAFWLWRVHPDNKWVRPDLRGCFGTLGSGIAK
jgi:hypothetical protein